MLKEQLTEEIERIINEYSNILFRICVTILANESDAEDAVQDTLIKYCEKMPEFESKEKEKSWLIKVAVNRCKDLLRFRVRRKEVSIDNIKDCGVSDEDGIVLNALLSLPKNYRVVMALYYVEGYKVKEIAQILGKTEGAVKKRLYDGRKKLEEKYRKEFL